MKLFQLLRLRDPDDDGRNVFAPADKAEPEPDGRMPKERLRQRAGERRKRVYRVPIYRVP